MSHSSESRLAATTKFVAILVVTSAVVVVAIEWSRRANISAPPSPVGDDFAVRPFPRKLRDAAGETIVVPERPKRIVSQTLATDEILLAICAPERIAALSSLAEDADYSNVVEEARGSAGRIKRGPEQVLQVHPDLIFVASYSRAETVQLLKASGAPVFRFANFDSVEEIKGNIRTVGAAIGCDSEAETLIRKMDESLGEIRKRIPAERPPFRVMLFGPTGYTAGAKTIFNDMVRAAGAINASAENGIEGFVKINGEQVLAWQPDFIVCGASQGEIESVKKRLRDDPVIAATKACRDGRIVGIDNRHLLAVSHHVVRGIEDLVDGLYARR